MIKEIFKAFNNFIEAIDPLGILTDDHITDKSYADSFINKMPFDTEWERNMFRYKVHQQIDNRRYVQYDIDSVKFEMEMLKDELDYLRDKLDDYEDDYEDDYIKYSEEDEIIEEEEAAPTYNPFHKADGPSMSPNEAAEILNRLHNRDKSKDEEKLRKNGIIK